MEEAESQNVSLETPIANVFVPPSIEQTNILSGCSYTYHTNVPKAILADLSTEVVLGIDEAGRGPVLGPMVYGLFYLPISQHRKLLADKHHFDDSKVLTPMTRSRLMELLCTPRSDLYETCGWATRVMSARDISTGMLKPAGTYNLNAQAMDATIDLIKESFAKGINIREIYIDTIGSPQVYQKKLERIFPSTAITVAKKADSLYPCVSAASVCAKVTRDAGLEASYRPHSAATGTLDSTSEGWGSGYPSDARSVSWLKTNMHPLFGWGSECRFSWGTSKDMLEAKNSGVKVDWPSVDEEDCNQQISTYFTSAEEQSDLEVIDKLSHWFGRPVSEEVFGSNFEK